MSDPMKRVFANDRGPLSRRTVTDEGFLVASASTLARTGIQEYRAHELGLDADKLFKANDVVRLYRPPEEVFDAESMASFESVPVTVDHPPGGVTADNWRDVSVGDVHRITKAGEFLRGDVVVRDAAAIKAIDEGKTELSNGYSFVLDLSSGFTPDGSAFDGVMRKIRGNHVAIVDVARCGAACRLADSQPQSQGNNQMARKIVVDGIQIEADETVASAVEKLQASLASHAAEIVQLKAAAAAPIQVGDCGSMPVTALVALAQDQAKKLAQFAADYVPRSEIGKIVAARASLVEEIKAVAPSIEIGDKSDDELRRLAVQALADDDASKAVVEAVLAGKSVVDAAPEAIASAFAAGKVARNMTAKRATGAALLGLGAGAADAAAGDKVVPFGRSAAMAGASRSA
jgi:uncharacterized protein